VKGSSFYFYISCKFDGRMYGYFAFYIITLSLGFFYFYVLYFIKYYFFRLLSYYLIFYNSCSYSSEFLNLVRSIIYLSRFYFSNR
jgi:hypothetical protein